MSDTLHEHHGYIADSVRMERFAAAIAQAVKPGDVVVDIGCGFAPLGLMCLRAGAARVWGIDDSEAIEIARETAKRAGFGERYHCLRENSFRAEPPERADVLICDHVGYFGVDYGILALIDDARSRLLKPGGTVIPMRLTLEIAAVASGKCRKLADRWTGQSMPKDFHWLQDYGVNSAHSVEFEAVEVASDAGALILIDLTQTAPALLRGEVELKVKHEARLDGLGGWFSAELAAGIAMTNSPLDPQRIARQQLFLPFDQQLEVSEGDILEVALSVDHGSRTFAWKALNRRSGEARSQSTWRSKILAPDDLVPAEGRVPGLGQTGRASLIVASYVDGQRTAREIEDLVLADHPALFPSGEEMRRFVRRELARLAR